MLSMPEPDDMCRCAPDETGVAIRIGETPYPDDNLVHMATSVLIVDDHPSFRASARMLLESEGFDVVGEAEDGEGALVAVRELRPDVVLLDIDGPEVAARLAAANGLRPAIVLTSSRDLHDLGAVGGVRGFIPKSELSGAALEALL
jgi:DNA-binding NarL/FixJ family response regulator